MTRILPAGLAAGLLGWAVAALLGYAPAPDPGAAARWIAAPVRFADPLVVAAVAALVALLALVVAWVALGRAARSRAELDRFAHAVERMLADAARTRSAEAQSIAEIGDSVARELDRLGGLVDGHRSRAPNGTASPPRLPEATVPPDTENATRDASAPEPGGAERSLRRALDEEQLELSLQAIVSLAHGAAAAFEAFVHLGQGDGASTDVRRIVEPVRDLDRARFERRFVQAAMAVGRQRLGPASETMPVHVAVSDALLSSEQEFGRACDEFAAYPALGRSVVLSLPWAVLFDERHRHGLQRLSRLEIGLAVEGWEGETGRLMELKRRGVGFVKLDADLLLDRVPAPARFPGSRELVEAAQARGLGVIAVDVANDDDAINLIEIGVDLMCGPRFAGPRRLRAEDDTRMGRAAAE